MQVVLWAPSFRFAGRNHWFLACQAPRGLRMRAAGPIDSASHAEWTTFHPNALPERPARRDETGWSSPRYACLGGWPACSVGRLTSRGAWSWDRAKVRATAMFAHSCSAPCAQHCCSRSQCVLRPKRAAHQVHPGAFRLAGSVRRSSRQRRLDDGIQVVFKRRHLFSLERGALRREVLHRGPPRRVVGV